VSNLFISADDQRMGLALRSAMWAMKYLRRAAMSEYMIAAVALAGRFDRPIGLEGAIVGNGSPFLWVTHPFTSERMAPGASPFVAVVSAVMMRFSSHRPRASPRWARVCIDGLSMRYRRYSTWSPSTCCSSYHARRFLMKRPDTPSTFGESFGSNVA
jgi:hypothetical protein